MRMADRARPNGSARKIKHVWFRADARTFVQHKKEKGSPSAPMRTNANERCLDVRLCDRKRTEACIASPTKTVGIPTIRRYSLSALLCASDREVHAHPFGFIRPVILLHSILFAFISINQHFSALLRLFSLLLASSSTTCKSFWFWPFYLNWHLYIGVKLHWDSIDSISEAVGYISWGLNLVKFKLTVVYEVQISLLHHHSSWAMLVNRKHTKRIKSWKQTKQNH